jgi:hypothetical protein
MLLIAGTLLTLLFAGCAEVNYVRDAQSSFNEAARLENQARMDRTYNPAPAVNNKDVIRAGYANAVFSLSRLTSKQIETLKSDNLWGLALTIKALSYWRLGDYDKMEQTRNEAASYANQLYPRDKALMAALPGLRRNDEAWALIFANTQGMQSAEKSQRLSEVDQLLDSAIGILDTARRPVDNPEVQAYLTQAILSCYRNKMTAHRVLAGGTYSSSDKANAKDQVRALDCSFKKYLDGTDLAEARSQVVGPWQDRLGFPADDCTCTQ